MKQILVHLKPNNFPRYIDQLTELEGKINEIDATKFNHSVKKSVEVENENENEEEVNENEDNTQNPEIEQATPQKEEENPQEPQEPQEQQEPQEPQ